MSKRGISGELQTTRNSNRPVIQRHLHKFAITRQRHLIDKDDKFMHYRLGEKDLDLDRIGLRIGERLDRRPTGDLLGGLLARRGELQTKTRRQRYHKLPLSVIYAH